MVVWLCHARVGHRQGLYPKNLHPKRWGFFLCSGGDRSSRPATRHRQEPYPRGPPRSGRSWSLWRAPSLLDPWSQIALHRMVQAIDGVIACAVKRARTHGDGLHDDTDILVVGGGVNGAGIARDAAGRGLSVTLCEQDDLAAHTSSASTKLIHGGLRYLEQYEFRLVAKALAEREVILRLAPHISWPMMFVLTHESHLRPVWMIRLGLLLYDSLGAG